VRPLAALPVRGAWTRASLALERIARERERQPPTIITIGQVRFQSTFDELGSEHELHNLQLAGTAHLRSMLASGLCLQGLTPRGTSRLRGHWIRCSGRGKSIWMRLALFDLRSISPMPGPPVASCGLAAVRARAQRRGSSGASIVARQATMRAAWRPSGSRSGSKIPTSSPAIRPVRSSARTSWASSS
jgi:hypothetical protein